MLLTKLAACWLQSLSSTAATLLRFSPTAKGKKELLVVWNGSPFGTPVASTAASVVPDEAGTEAEAGAGADCAKCCGVPDDPACITESRSAWAEGVLPKSMTDTLARSPGEKSHLFAA